MSQEVQHIEVKKGTIYMDRPGYYFGYGLEFDPEVMEAIVGHPLIMELGVMAVGKQLAIQELDQIPEIPSDELGGRSAQQIVANAWKKYTDKPFSSYTLRNSENRGDMVEGTLYVLGMEDALALVEWDIASPKLKDAAWRYWDHGVELVDGRQVMTLCVGYDQEVDRVVPGTEYDIFLNDKHATMSVIQDVFAEK